MRAQDGFRRERRTRVWLARAAARLQSNLEVELAKAGDDEVKALVRYIGEHLFEPEFSISKLKADLEPSRKTLRSFKADVGCGLKELALREKLRAAEWLLAESDLEIWKIARLVGYGSLASLGEAFQAWAGKPPSQVERKRAANGEVEALDSAACVRLWLRASVDELSPAERQQLWSWIEDRLGPHDDHVWLDVFADKLIDHLDELEWEQQLELVRGVSFLDEPLRLFDRLSASIIPASRLDRDRGVEMARLALAHLESCAEQVGEEIADLRTLAEARLGNALRLADDWPEAEQAFARAERAWATPRSQSDPRAEAELRFLVGTLRLHQRRSADALASLNRAVSLTRAFGPLRLLAQSLLHRGEVLGYQNKTGEAILDFSEARDVLRGLDEPGLTLIAHQNLAVDLTALGRLGEAAGCLAAAREVCSTLGRGSEADRAQATCATAKLDWIEGRIQVRQG